MYQVLGTWYLVCMPGSAGIPPYRYPGTSAVYHTYLVNQIPGTYRTIVPRQHHSSICRKFLSRHHRYTDVLLVTGEFSSVELPAVSMRCYYDTRFECRRQRCVLPVGIFTAGPVRRLDIYLLFDTSGSAFTLKHRIAHIEKR